jgi:PD-(D/E)XK nuclease superfamily
MSTVHATAQHDLPAYIDSSMLATFRACPKKFYWTYISNKIPSGESIHLIAGGAFAAGCDAARRTQFAYDKKIDLIELQSAAVKAFSLHWGDYEAPENHAKSFENMVVALCAYLDQHHPFDDMVQPIRTPTGEPCSEFSFAVPLESHVLHPSGAPFLFAGRFDLLGTFGDLPVILDEKTTGSLGTYWLQSWDMRGQFMGYCWALNLLGYKVRDAIVRGIAIQKTKHDFLTCPIRYSDHMIDRWELTLYQTLQRIVWCYNNDQWDYNFADSCSSYGGCPYKTLCLAKDPNHFMNNYQERTWSPITMKS